MIAWLNYRGVPLLFAAASACLVAMGVVGIARGAQEQEFDSWLVLCVDISGSVTRNEYEVQRTGYVEVLLDPMIGQALDRTAVAIVEFGTMAIVSVPWTDVRSAGAAYRERERPFQGNTCVACALEIALQLLDGKSGKRVVDISGDGIDNTKGEAAVLAFRDLATTQGIEVNTLALLVEPDQTTYGGYGPAAAGGISHAVLQKFYAEMANGFAMAIASLDDLANALRRKLFAEISSYIPAEAK